MARRPSSIMLYTTGQNEPPNHLAIYFDRRRVFNDTALAQVLEDYPSVTIVSLHGLGSLWANSNATLPAFRQKLETRANLRYVMITAGSTHQAPPLFTSPFLRTLMKNSSLNSVRLEYMRIYTEDLAAILGAKRSGLGWLRLSNVVMESPRGSEQKGSMELTQAMKSNMSIKSLRMHCLQGDAAQAILTGLSSNQSVDTLGLSWDMVVAAEESSQTVHKILKDNKKIKRFILPDVQSLTDAGHEEISNRIATDLINSDCVTEIEFDTAAALRTFQSILREKTNLRSLGLPVDCLSDQSKAALTELLGRPKSPLRSLSLVRVLYISRPRSNFHVFSCRSCSEPGRSPRVGWFH